MSEINQNARRCALYLRSSKDRTDVSIDAQRRELQALATFKGLRIVEEFADAVESGKDANRPGFQALIRKLNERGRPWSVILMVDTSRLARNQYVAHSFMHECRKRGIDVIFAKTPELDGVTGIILPAVLHAMDQVHSFMSREKGLAGMAENVRQGFRAGGRAPFGYRLEYIPTGAIREGEAVTKSHLVPNGDAQKIAAYLKACATGAVRRSLAARLGLDLAATSLNGIEWNALTYAGHTVWNVHNEKADGKYLGGMKRRPREEWVIQRDTHEPLITETEAEAILARLTSGKIKTRQTRARHLLTGLLQTEDGEPWYGMGEYYRTFAGRKSIKSYRVDEALLRQLADDMQSPDFARGIVRNARAAAGKTNDGAELANARKEMGVLQGKIDRLTGLLAETDTPSPLLRAIEGHERELQSVRANVETMEAAASQTRALRELSEADVSGILAAMADSLEDLDRDTLKDALQGLIERVTLDPSTLTCCIYYKIPVKSRNNVASPRGAVAIPTIGARRPFQVLARTRRLKAA